MDSILKIVADENIPLARELFSSLGDVVTIPGRELSATDVADADVLLVRSVTPVNKELLGDSHVKFVGTCTIGIDHLDTTYLDQQGITWASAPGCNANSVVEYVLSVMANLKPDWLQASVGIIGCGNVGGRLYQRLKALGLTCCVYDPFLSVEQVPDLTTLEAVLNSDVVCVHAPLTKRGDHASCHLLSASELNQLKQNTLLISAGRGAVIDNQALKTVLNTRTDLQVALDVWEPEPLLDVELLEKVQLATPHIAGYSYDGKVLGTSMIYDALCKFLNSEKELDFIEPLMADSTLLLRVGTKDLQAVVNQTILAAYDVREDDARLREALTGKDAQLRAQAFDDLRKHYPQRRGFDRYTITSTESGPINETLAAVGFGLSK